MQTDPVTIVLFVGLWATFLWFPYLRTARTIAYLLTATALYVVAAGLAEPWPLIARGSLLLTVLAMHFQFSDVLSALPHAASGFRNSYVAINKHMATAYAEFETTGDRGPLETVLLQAVSDLRALKLPPGDQWLDVQTAAVELVERRLRMLRDRTDSDSDAALRYRTQRAEVHRRFWDALERSKSFWR